MNEKKTTYSCPRGHTTTSFETSEEHPFYGILRVGYCPTCEKDWKRYVKGEIEDAYFDWYIEWAKDLPKIKKYDHRYHERADSNLFNGMVSWRRENPPNHQIDI